FLVVADETGGALSAQTRRTGIGVGAGARHVVHGDAAVSTQAAEDHVVTSIVADLGAGDVVAVDKVIAHVWSRNAGGDSLLEATRAALDSGAALGWDGLLAAQQAVLDDMW